MIESLLAERAEKIDRLRENLSRVIQGKGETIDILIVALVAGGSVLMEDVPGVGKTTLAKALATSIDVTFRRIQFTPDLLPADILGTSIYNPVEGTFTFRRGPIFCHVLLADEINRASPRTQSALLEAMNEHQATIEGVSHPLEAPFLVIATENPIEHHGTYPLPEAQLDRFLVLLDLGYPDAETEVEILQNHMTRHPLSDIRPVLTREEVISMQSECKQVKIARSISEYIVALAGRSRQDSRLKLGVSPRGSLMLSRAAQALAYTRGRDFVLPDDVQHLAQAVLAHRVILTSKARYGGVTKREVIADMLSGVKVPT
jgi:MoxR-like ATPase